jgi:hypothetical protein
VSALESASRFERGEIGSNGHLRGREPNGEVVYGDPAVVAQDFQDTVTAFSHQQSGLCRRSVQLSGERLLIRFMHD